MFVGRSKRFFKLSTKTPKRFRVRPSGTPHSLTPFHQGTGQALLRFLLVFFAFFSANGMLSPPHPSQPSRSYLFSLSNHHPRNNRTLPNHTPDIIMSLQGTFLLNRPTEAELQARGLLEDASHLAPALQSTARALRQAMVKDTLASELASRPDAHSLQDKGVHSPSSNLSPSLLSAVHTLEHSLKKDAVAKSLRERPTKEALESEGILSPPMA